MPPYLALFLTTAFVLYALRSEQGRDYHPGAALLWPLLWYLVVASRPLGVWLNTWGIPLPTGGDEVDGSIIDRYFYLTLAIIGWGVLSKRRFSWSELFKANPWVTTLFVWIALSVVWSHYPYVSFKRFIKLVGAVVMAMVVLTDTDPLQATTTILRRTLYIHLPMSILCIKYFRDIGVGFDWSGASQYWQGISTSKNTLGQVAMLGVVYFLWDIRRAWPTKRWRNIHVIYLAMAVYLLKGSEDSVSMTSMMVSIFALLIFLRIQSLRDRPAAVPRFTIAAFLATITLVTLVVLHSIFLFSEDSFFGRVISAFGRDITLTDRTFIWQDVYHVASDNPLLGVGFGGFWIGRIANIPWNENMTWVLGQAHSGYIDAYLQTGIVGVALLVVAIVTTFRSVMRVSTADFDFGCLKTTLFLTILFINITESTFLRGDHHLWFLLQLVMWTLPVSASPHATPSVRAAKLAPPEEAVAWHRTIPQIS